MMQELPIPPDSQNAEQAVEVFRGWIIDQRLQCSLRPTVWAETPGMWGILLADAANHIANAIAEETGKDSQELLSEISRVFLAENESPTDECEGKFVD